MTKSERLRKLETPEGVIAALAIDQRKSLRILIAQAAGVETEAIPDAQLGEFKAAVTRHLTPHASAVLLDPEYGSSAFEQRASGCGLLMTYEMDGYENPRPHRMLALMPEYSVRRLRDLGADGIKILLSWAPFDQERANDEKRVLVERIGAECAALDMPFLLEPVGYDPGGLDVKSFEYARRKPEIVIRSMEEFSKDFYRVDVLKVEFPVNVAHVPSAYSRQEALDHFRHADSVARRPYIYLSAGVSTQKFIESLGLAADSGARFSGILCGRATWQDGVPVYARQGLAAFEQWLETTGASNMRSVHSLLSAACPASR